MHTAELEATLRGWFTGRLPDTWFTAAPEITLDGDEIAVVGALPGPELPEDGDAAGRAGLVAGYAARFRESTREQRVRIAREAEQLFDRKVSWGVVCADERIMYTNRSIPVMTRLRLPERRVLDTLVDSGVARSRSDALAWCVRLVGKNADAWLAELREALQHVERARAAGPTV